MDDVRVHYTSPEPAAVQALAYTQGTDIHVASGQEKHLPHEAWHVVQQKQGRVKPTLQMKGVAINDNAGLEREAETMGAQSLRVSSSPVRAGNRPPQQAPTGVTQFVWVQSARAEFYWDKLLGGLQWYFDPETDNFRYKIIDDLAVPIAIWDQIEALEGSPLPEQELDRLGFGVIATTPQEARIEPDTSSQVPAAGMVSATVAQHIRDNLRQGTAPFRPELGLGGCSWFIWKGQGEPFTSVDKVKFGQEAKNVPIAATVRLPAHSLVITTQFLAERHALYLQDPSFLAEAEAKWRDHNRIGATVPLGSKKRSNLQFYQRGLAEQAMCVSIGRMVASHPAMVGVVVLQSSDFSLSGDGKFLVVADASRIEVVSINPRREDST